MFARHPFSVFAKWWYVQAQASSQVLQVLAACAETYDSSSQMWHDWQRWLQREDALECARRLVGQAAAPTSDAVMVEGSGRFGKQWRKFWQRAQQHDLGVSPDQIQQWAQSDRPPWQWLSKWDPAFPECLRTIESPPSIVWSTQSLAERINSSGQPTSGARIAVVGTRRPTAYGRLAAATLTADLVSHWNDTIVSGCAQGIDMIAHQTAVQQGGVTIGVLPNGYEQLSRRLHAYESHPQWVMISEFPPHAAVQKWQFAQRNRLIAALSEATLVVEAGTRSGTLLTAAAARDQGKDVFVVTQPLQSRFAEGAVQQVWQGAHLVASAQHVHELLNQSSCRPQQLPWQTNTPVDMPEVLSAQARDGVQAELLTHLWLNHGEVLVSSLTTKGAYSPTQWQQALVSLELRGVVSQDFGVVRLNRRV